MRLNLKLLMISELVLLVAVLALVLPFWRDSRNRIIEGMQTELKAIATTAALEVDGDLHKQIRGPDDADDEAFLMLREQLRAVQVANDVRHDHLYTFYRDGNLVRFAVMLHPEPFIGDPYTLQAAMIPVLEEGTVNATGIYADKHGKWISAYAPIRDGEGDIVGLLEIDKNSSMYLAAFYDRTRLIAVVGLLALVVSSILGWVVLNRLVIRPIGVIRRGIDALGRHEFDHHIDLHTGDEFQDLARTFNSISAQLDVASMIQAGFFPERLPEHPAYRIAGLSIPCDATGGDYYDAFELPDGRIAVVVADVSGHGLGASLLMATCRSALRALSVAKLSPGELIERLDTMMQDDLSGGRFITMIYGVLDHDGTFTYANAGHGPALCICHDRAAQFDSHRPPLGIDLPPAEGDEHESSIALEPGQRILLVSDGLSEAMNDAGEHFGVRRIESTALRREADADEIVDRLRDDLLAHCNGPSRSDDVTILCVDRVEQ